MKNRHTSRGLSLHFFSLGQVYKNLQPFLGKLLSMLPAFFYSCDTAVENTIPAAMAISTKVTLSSPPSTVSSLDVFVFKDNALQKLDCYQRFEDMDDWKGLVTSGGGKRIITVIANSPYDMEYWFPMNSRSFLKGVHLNLEDEVRRSPTMFGEVSVDTGEDSGIEDMDMKPIISEIKVNSLCCDFTGRAYAGERLSDIKIYLTNVNAECPVPEAAGTPPLRIINAGRLVGEDIENFKDPGLLVQNIPGEIGADRIYPSVSLWCYQSNHPEETPGTPFTRLVIEGKVAGRTFYWPIDINRNTPEEPGIWRGRCYSYDIKITRKGTASPDIPVCPTDVIINQGVKEWKEKEDYAVRF